MEHSKLISTIIAQFKIAYPYYFKDLTNEEFIGLIGMYQEYLSEYNELTLNSAVKSIIKKNKFMPTIKELIDECDACKTYRRNAVLEVMLKDGYFKRSSYGELDGNQEVRNYEKALMWLEKGVIPDWLLKDMKEYGYLEDKVLLTNNNSSLLELKGASL